MLICSDCGSQFEKPDTYRETHGFNSPPFEEKRCCPFCKSTNIHEKNLTHCRCCGAKLTDGGEYCSDAGGAARKCGAGSGVCEGLQRLIP